MMPYYYTDHMNSGWGILEFLFWLAAFVDLVLLGIWLVRVTFKK